MHQTGKEPVVNKTARVAEEVIVRKDVTERTETVRDDVRREEVDVQNADRRPESRSPHPDRRRRGVSRVI